LKHNVFALVVHGRPEPCQSLKPVLRKLGVDTYSVSSCEEAAQLLEQTHPYLVFTDTRLPDGTWIDIVNLAEDSPVPVCAILVGRSKDAATSEAALNYGAFDLISPPFDADDVSQLLTEAMALVRARREHHARTVAAA
jgi:two-component system, NtrC family, response regulator PilR